MDIVKQHTACFTGHRPKPWMRYNPGDKHYAALCDALDRAIVLLCEQYDVNMFLCGMADGFDLVAAQRVLALRRTGKIPESTSLVAVQPYPEHREVVPGERWQRAYEEVLQCSCDTCVVSLQYRKDAFRRRNAYMVDHSRFIIAYWNGARRSGTGQTVRMAQQSEDRILINLYDLL